MSGCDIGICPSSPVCLLCIRRNRMLKQMELDNHPTTASKKSTPISAALVNIKTNTLIVESYEQLFPVFLEIFPQYSRYSLSLFLEILSTTALAPIIASVVALCLSWNRFPIYSQIPPSPASGSINKFRAHFVQASLVLRSIMPALEQTLHNPRPNLDRGRFTLTHRVWQGHGLGLQLFRTR